MAPYINVFQEDAKRQAVKRKPKPRSRKTDETVRALRDVSRATAAPKSAATKPAPSKSLSARSTPARAASPAEARFYENVQSAQKRKSGERKGNLKAGAFGYAGDLAGTQSDEGSLLGRVLRGGARDVVDITTGLPGAAVLGVRAATYPIAKPLGMAGVGPAAGYAAGTERLLGQAARGVADEYSRVYGPVLDVSALDIARDTDDARRKAREFGNEFVEHPVLRGLDVAALFSGGGAAAGLGARAVAKAAPASRAGQAAARFGDRSILPPGTPLPGGGVATGARYRPPKPVTGRVADVEGAAERTLMVPQRPLTPNPLTRPAQRAMSPVLERAGERIRSRAERLQVPEGSPARFGERAIGAATSRLTPQARFDRAQRKGAGDIIVRREAEADKLGANMVRTAGLDEAFRHLGREHSRLPKMPKRHLTAEHLALRLHMEDVLSPRGGKTSRELRDLWVAERQPHIEAAKNPNQPGGPLRTKRAEQQLAQVAAIPDDLLDLSSGTPGAMRVAAALEAAQKVGSESQRLNIEAGVITPEKAAEVAQRRSAVGIGGARYAPEVLREMKAAGASKAERQAVRREAIGEAPELAEARGGLAAARAEERRLRSPVDRGREKVELKQARERHDKTVAAARTRQRADETQARVAVAHQRRMAERDRKALAERRRRESARDLAQARAARAEAPKAASAAGAFGVGERAGKASRDIRSAPEPRGRLREPSVVREGVEQRRVREDPAGPSATKSAAFGRRLEAEGRLSKMKRSEREAALAERGLVQARIESAKKRAAPVSRAEDAVFNQNLRAAEQRLNRMLANRNATSKELADARRDLLVAERRYAATRNVRRGTPSEIAAAANRRREYVENVRRLEEKALQTARTKPTRPELVGSKAVYIKDKPIDRMTAAFGGGRKRGTSGPPKAQVSHDTLLNKAGFDMNPELLLREARRAADVKVGPMSREALAELIDLAAYKIKGKWATGGRAISLAKVDPDRAVLVNVGALKKALGKIDELPEGKFLTADEVGMFHGKGKGLQALPEDAKSGDYVLISKAAADVWRETMTGRFGIQHYDNFMSWWKGGLLSLQPRWYINSTVGIATQYGLLTGGDFVSLVQANRMIGRAFKKGRQEGKIRASTPAEVVQNTLAENIVGSGSALAGKPGGRAMMAGFRVNNRLEGFWRRGAHLSVAKRAYKREGVKVRKMDEGEIARLLDEMPADMQRALARDMSTFMGDFRKFNAFEKKVLRRIFPFYSWLRVITRLTYRLPFRSPLRAEFLAIASELGQVVNPLDPLRDIYRRGAIPLPGGIRLQTGALNPAATLSGFFEAIGSNSPGKVVGELLSWSEPAIQFAVSQGTGIEPFTQRAAFSPTGYGGGAGVFGRPAKHENPVTGLLEDVSPRAPWEEALLEAVAPFAVSPARRLIAGSDTLYDTATTRQAAAVRFPQLAPILFPKGLPGFLGKPAEKREVIYPRSRPKVDTPVGRSLPGILGVPLLRENTQELVRKRRQEAIDYRKAQIQTRRRILRERARSR